MEDRIREQKLSRYLKALGHPVRLLIIRKIMNESRCPNGFNPCKCGDNCEGMNCKCGCKCGKLVEEFVLSQSTISQHIKELKEVGLINLQGRKGDYTINHDNISECFELLKDFFGYNKNLSEKTEGL